MKGTRAVTGTRSHRNVQSPEHAVTGTRSRWDTQPLGHAAVGTRSHRDTQAPERVLTALWAK